MRKSKNNFRIIGGIIFLIWMVSNQFDLLPDSLACFMGGISLVLLVVGNFGSSKLRNYKKNLLYKILGKPVG